MRGSSRAGWISPCRSSGLADEARSAEEEALAKVDPFRFPEVFGPFHGFKVTSLVNRCKDLTKVDRLLDFCKMQAILKNGYKR